MVIQMNPQQQVDASEVVETFPHLTWKLELYGGYYDRRRFCRKLKEEIINFDTSKLQTQVIYIFITIMT